MAQDTPPLRIGHAERDRTIALLQEHTAAGRLELDEFEERLEQVAKARTTVDLDAVLVDLPNLAPHATSEPYTAAVNPPATVYPAWSGFPAWSGSSWHHHRGRRPVPGWIALSLMMVAIWAIAGFGYFWPIWVIVPTALGALGGCGGRRRHHPRHDRISA